MKNYIINWNVDSELFWITETFPIKYYGLLFALGMVITFNVVKGIYKKENVPVENLEKVTFYAIIGTLIGARLGHCLFYDPLYYSQNLVEMFLPIKQINGAYKFIGYRGLASHGGTLGVLIALGIYCKRNKVNFLWLVDRIAIGAPIAAAFIRFGNFMNSEIYGQPTNGTWGIVFQKIDMLPRHPAQLYEAFSYLIIFSILIVVYRSKSIKNTNGQLFGLFLIILFTARFIIEFFKVNQVDFENTMRFNMGQILSIPFVLLGIILIMKSKLFNNLSKQ